MKKTLKELCGALWPDKRFIDPEVLYYDHGYNDCLGYLSKIEVDIPDPCRHEALDRQKLAEAMMNYDIKIGLNLKWEHYLKQADAIISDFKPATCKHEALDEEKIQLALYRQLGVSIENQPISLIRFICENFKPAEAVIKRCIHDVEIPDCFNCYPRNEAVRVPSEDKLYWINSFLQELIDMKSYPSITSHSENAYTKSDHIDFLIKKYQKQVNDEQTIKDREEKDESDFEKWFKEVHPENCKCGQKIIDHKFGINGIDVCEKCFMESTKHMKFGVGMRWYGIIDEN